MKNYLAASRYARALLELALQSDELEKIDRDFLKLTELLDRHPEISHLVLNSTIPPAEKEDFLDKVFHAEVSRLLINLVKVLIRKKRFAQIREIQERYHELFEKKRGIQEVRVITALPLSNAGEEKLKKALQHKLKAEIRLLGETDPSILGGMILRFDGTEVNTSFRNRLAELRQILIH